MSEIFNIRRFGRYLLAELKYCLALYGPSLAILCLLDLIVYFVIGMFGVLSGGGWISSGIGWRVAAFALGAIILVISMPSMCYGKLTEKQEGSTWLLVPASILEKFLTVLLICIVLIPATFIIVFLCLDWLMCLVDPGCGVSLLSWTHYPFRFLNDLSAADVADITVISAVEGIGASFDDILKGLLVFLLGGIFFKSHKIAKTVFVLIAVGIVVSFFWTVAAVVFARDGGDIVAGIIENIDNIRWISTTTDVVICVALAAAVFLRIKYLKH